MAVMFGSRLGGRVSVRQRGVPVVKPRRSRLFATAPTASTTTEQKYSLLPRDADSMVVQAAQALQRAAADGKGKRQIVELLNPVNEKAFNFLSTEPTDYPCSNMKEFETLVNVTKQLLSEFLVLSDAASSAAAVSLRVRRIDEGGIDGDLCALVSAELPSGRRVVAIVWPTAEKLKTIKKLAEDPSIEVLLIVNPLWKTEGNLVSEFGIGPWRKANEEFVASFEASYRLVEQRVGAPSSVSMASGTRYATGAVLRLLRVYPGPQEAHAMSSDGASQAIASFPEKPSYRQLEDAVTAGRAAKLAIFAVAQRASAIPSMQAQLEARDAAAAAAAGADSDAGASTSASTSAGPGAGAFPSSAEVAQMDPKAVRRLLTGLGLPGAGTPAKLQQRALAVAEALEGGASLRAAVAAAQKLR